MNSRYANQEPSENFERLKEYVTKRMTELHDIIRLPALFLANYLDDIKHTIDLKYVNACLEEQNKTDQDVDKQTKLEDRHQLMIEKLCEQEKELQGRLQNLWLTEPTFLEINKEVEKAFENFDESCSYSHEADRIYQTIAHDVSQELDRIKSKVFNNKAIFFYEKNGPHGEDCFDCLIVADGAFLDDHDIKLLTDYTAYNYDDLITSIKELNKKTEFNGKYVNIKDDYVLDKRKVMLFYLSWMLEEKLETNNGVCIISKESIFPSVLQIYLGAPSQEFSLEEFYELDEYLEDEPIVDIDENIFELMPNVTHFQLKKMNLKKTKFSAFSKLANLEALSFRYSRVPQFESNCFDIKSLRYLDLTTTTHYRIRGLDRDGSFSIEDDTFSPNLVNLRTLIIKGFKLMRISVNAFKNLTSLVELNLSLSGISALDPNVFDSLLNLEKLYLNNNNLTELKKGTFKSLKRLKLLSIKDNNLTMLDEDTCKDLAGLENLNIARNFFEITEQTFKHLSNLIKLKMYNIKLEKISQKLFANNLKLQVLGLGANRIKEFEDDTFHSLIHLKSLNMYGCELTAIKRSYFSQLVNLEELYLHQNNFDSIEEDSFANLKSLKVLLVSYCAKEIELKKTTNKTDFYGINTTSLDRFE